MMQIVEMTHEEKVKMYMKLNKRELIEMLIEANRVIDSLTETRPVFGYETVVGTGDFLPHPCRITTTDGKY